MKPTIANWGAAKLSGLCRRLHRQDDCTGSASAEPGLPGRRDARDDPLANRFDELDTLMSLLDNANAYSMFEDVCRAGGVYSERVSGQRDLPAAIERSLTVRRTENAPRAPQHYLPCLAPKRTCSRLLLQLTLCFGQP